MMIMVITTNRFCYCALPDMKKLAFDLRLPADSFQVITSLEDNLLQATVNRVIHEEKADIHRIDSLYLELCKDFFRGVSGQEVGLSDMATRKDGICRRLVLGAGEAIKSLALAKKMVGYVIEAVVSQDYNFLYDQGSLIDKANKINTKLIAEVKSKKNLCWSNVNACSSGQEIKQLIQYQKRWVNVYNEGVELVTKMFETETEKNMAPMPGNTSRMLFSRRRKHIRDKMKARRKHRRKKRKERRKKIVKKVKKVTKKVVKKVKKVVKKILKAVKGIFKRKVRLVVTDFLDKANKRISSRPESLSKKENTRIIIKALKKFSLAKAMKRCEHRYGKGQCYQYNPILVCPKCRGEYIFSEVDDGKCGCSNSESLPKTPSSISGTLDIWNLFHEGLEHEEGHDEKQSGDWNGQTLYSYYFEIEDYVE